MADRTDLINQLAASMGAGQFSSTAYEESRFDADTGTLWCKGLAITKSTAEKAVQYFETMERKCGQEEAGRQMAMIYRCAIESIKMVGEPDVKVFLQNRAKNAK